MKLLKIILFILFIFRLHGYAQEQTYSHLDYFGEEIGYSLKAGIFHVGVVDMAFTGDSTDCGAYIILNARSTGVVNFIKDVHYKFDACVDTSTGFTTHSTRIVKEGNFFDLDEVYYDRTSNPDSTIVTTENNDTILVPKDIYDILLAFFQFRKNFISPDMPIGKVVYLETFFVDTEWDLNMKYVGKERIKTKFGSVNCYKFMPRTEIGRYFKTNEDMTIWVTDNQYHIPVRFEAKLKFATLYADIVSYSKPFNKRKTASSKKANR